MVYEDGGQGVGVNGGKVTASDVGTDNGVVVEAGAGNWATSGIDLGMGLVLLSWSGGIRGGMTAEADFFSGCRGRGAVSAAEAGCCCDMDLERGFRAVGLSEVEVDRLRFKSRGLNGRGGDIGDCARTDGGDDSRVKSRKLVLFTVLDFEGVNAGGDEGGTGDTGLETLRSIASSRRRRRSSLSFSSFIVVARAAFLPLARPEETLVVVTIVRSKSSDAFVAKARDDFCCGGGLGCAIAGLSINSTHSSSSR